MRAIVWALMIAALLIVVISFSGDKDDCEKLQMHRCYDKHSCCPD